MANKTIYGKWSKSTGKVTFEDEACDGSDYVGCYIEDNAYGSEHKGQIAVTIEEDYCDDTYFADCFDVDLGRFKLYIPDDCCQQIYADDDCSCFLDYGNSTDWDSQTVYSTGDLVRYGFVYRSLTDNNQGNQPNAGYPWEYVAQNAGCYDCYSKWDDYPPFGGVGKTPLYIRATFADVEEAVEDNWANDLNGTRILTYTGGVHCHWQYRASTFASRDWTIDAWVDCDGVRVRVENDYASFDTEQKWIERDTNELWVTFCGWSDVCCGWGENMSNANWLNSECLLNDGQNGYVFLTPGLAT